MALQIRRGLESARTSITPAEGEVLYVTDTKRMYIGDGTTLGGVQVGGNLLFPIIDNIRLGYATTATAGGTTTLTVTSGRQQLFTGSANQTIVLPVTSTLALGVSYEIENVSTGTLTVQSSGLNTIGTIPPGVTGHLLCISTSLTTAAAWDMDYVGFATLTGTGNAVLATSPTISGLTLTGTLTAGGGVGTNGQVLTSTGTGVQWATASGGGGTTTNALTIGTGLSGTSFNGSSAVTIALATSGAIAGSYGSVSGTYVTVPTINVDQYGRITSISSTGFTSGGGSSGNSFSTIYANAGGTVASPNSGTATILTASGASDMLYLIAGSNVTITASSAPQKAIMISSTGGAASGFTWSTTTSSFNQGSTTITYPSGATTSGGRLFVAFFGNNLTGSNISTPTAPGFSWTSNSGTNWYVYSTSTSSSGYASQSWNFANSNHMIYTTWIVTPGSGSPMASGMGQFSSSFSYSVSSMYNKTDTLLLGSTTSMLDMTTATITPPSGYTSQGSKKHPSDSSLSVIAYQNPTPNTSGSTFWGVSNNGNTYYSMYVNASI
jgi:hypothetical protein